MGGVNQGVNIKATTCDFHDRSATGAGTVVALIPVHMMLLPTGM